MAMTHILKVTFNWMKRKVINIYIVTKETPRITAIWLVVLNALFQLAISQRHIASLVRVKMTVSTPGATNYTAGMPSTGIGLFFFAFILLGLVSLFAVTRMVDIKSILYAIFASLATIGFGLVYVLKSTNPDNLHNPADVSESMMIMAIGFAIYAVAIMLLIFEIHKFIRHKGDR